METAISYLNSAGESFTEFALPMLIQSSVLMAILLGLDLILRKRVRAIFRYGIWMLVLVKLVLPASLSLPTGLSYWFADAVPNITVEKMAPLDAPVTTEPTLTIHEADVPIESVTAPALLDESKPGSYTFDPAKATTSAIPLTWRAIAFLIWLTVVMTMALFLVQRLLFIKRLIAEADKAGGPLDDALAECSARLGIHRKIAIRLSPHAASPSVCGLLRPVILFPQGLLDRLDQQQVKSVLLHELAHIKRADPWISSIQAFLQIVYFYNPLLWLANAVIRRVREQAVDEMVLVAMGEEAEDYPATLLDVSKLIFGRSTLSLRLIGVVESKAALAKRIKFMLSRPLPKRADLGLSGLAAVVIAAAVLLPMAKARPQNQPGNRSARNDPQKDFGLLILEDRQADDTGWETARLYLMGSNGDIRGALSGLSLKKPIGTSHILTIDVKRKILWVAENMGSRLWKFDLSTGKRLDRFEEIWACALAVEPESGNVWALRRKGKGQIWIVSPGGTTLAKYDIPGEDIVYSPYDKSFWVVGREVYKISRGGKTVGRIGNVGYMATSVSVDKRNGDAWTVIMYHPQRPESKNELWAVGANLKVKHKIDLGELRPYCIEVDSDNGIVWVGCLGTTLRYDTNGKKLKTARWASGLSVATGSRANEAFVADADSVQQVIVDATGAVESHSLTRSLYDESVTYRWLMKVPFSGAKLQSSPKLAHLASARTLSAHKLMEFGRALWIYANDHRDELPSSVDQLRSYLSEAKHLWCVKNVEYLGKGKTTADDPGMVLAYDRTILEQGEGTNALFLDSHVEFVKASRLKQLGIKTGPRSKVQD
ncbi:MAG: M56 family metallopeptidase [Phycisphaerales bacterium]|nr:MAG: M56 family metallopeptidase [Phycisphaerales bacterium]